MEEGAASWRRSERMRQKKRRDGPDSDSNLPDHKPLIPEPVLRFMASLPLTLNQMAWVNQFRDALLELLEDVDRMAVFVDVSCDILSHPTQLHPDASKRTIIWQLHHKAQPDDINVLVTTGTQDLLDMHKRHMQQLGFPFHEYNQPYCFTYTSHDQEQYLGLIMLFRRVDTQPISPQTLDIMEQLRPFLQFMLSDLVARSDYTVSTAIFRTTIGSLFYSFNLTVREREIFQLRLMGFSVDDIAEKTCFSRDAIKRYIKTIHRKTGARNFWQLFMQRLEPEMDDNTLLAAADIAYEMAKEGIAS